METSSEQRDSEVLSASCIGSLSWFLPGGTISSPEYQLKPFGQVLPNGSFKTTADLENNKNNPQDPNNKLQKSSEYFRVHYLINFSQLF
jgi:hypothetical protein